jgi:HEAT repeats
MKRLEPILAATVAMTMLVTAGCSKKESEPSTPPPPSTTTLNQSKPAPPTALPPPSPPEVKPPQVSAPAAPPAAGEETPAQLAAQVKRLEADYQNTPDFQKRVTIIYDLSSTDSPDTIDAIARLFFNEKDEELKIELINSLMDIDGQNEKKLAILSAGVRPDQPKEVRLEAIDGMGDIQDKRAVQVLQGLAGDADEDVRISVNDTIEQLQDVEAPPPQAQQPPAK